MTNIWGFLLQTISVTLVAALLFVVKYLLADKLSPRWQYGIWSLLALRIIVPVMTTRFVLLPVPLWVETWKATVEQTMGSVFSAVYLPVSVRFPIPWIAAAPHSITDWLFVLYAVGVVGTLLWYGISYLRLRLLLRHGTPVNAAVSEQIQRICEQYQLRACQVITVRGLPSAFICGILHPVLVLPEGVETDDKVLLHELLHLKFQDALQSVLWCVLRAMHWCNPFLQYIFKRIGNDMEALCDQRVLERLDGEERREYGKILLSMVNGHYPRAPGTTSVSNGGKNISRRIASIGRFKKYPKGMALVSICVAIVLSVPVLAGSVAEYEDGYYRPAGIQGFNQAMAIARLNRCSTLAGALDTYAKGLMYDNGIYIAMASSLEKHEALAAEMRDNVDVDGWVDYHLYSGTELEYLSPDNGYYIYNIKEQADGSYTALLVFYVDAYRRSEGEGFLRDENGVAYSGSVAVPVTVYHGESWTVEEEGERKFYLGVSLDQLTSPAVELPWLQYFEQTGHSGTVTIGVNSYYTVENTKENGGFNFFGSTSFNETVMPAAQFDRAYEHTCYEYRFHGTEAEREALEFVGLQIASVNVDGSLPDFAKANMDGRSGGGSCSDGYRWSSRDVEADWDGTLSGGGGHGGSVDTADALVATPERYAVRIFWNGEQVENFILGEVE